MKAKDWPLNETGSDGTIKEKVQNQKEVRDSTWTLVEYRPGRYAKVTPDGAVMGRASEAEVRAWFGGRSQEPPRNAPRPQDPDVPSADPQQATEGRGLQAWFAAQRQAARVAIADAPSESTEEEADKPGIRDWLAAQRRDVQPGTDRAASDGPDEGSGQSPDESRSPSRIPAGDKGAGGRQTDIGPEEPEPADAEPRQEAQGQDPDPEPHLLQAELQPSEADERGPETAEPEPDAVQVTDLRQPDPTPQGPEKLATRPSAAMEPEPDSELLQAVQLAFMPAEGEEDKDNSLDGRLDPAGEAEPILEDPSAPQEEAPAAMEPPPAQATEPFLEEAASAHEREPTLAESPPSAVEVPTREARPDEPAETPTLERDEPEPTQLAMEPGDAEEVEVTQPLTKPSTPEPMTSDRGEWMTDKDLYADDDVDWLDPGTPPGGAGPSGATARDQVPVSAPGIPHGVSAGGTGAGSMGVGPAQDLDEAPPETGAFDGYDRWLWVDPRQEPGYDVGDFDLADFLSRAADLFRSKEWTAGREPARLAAHPYEVANGLKAMADGLGLEVVSDPRITPGTYRLGLAADKDA